MKRTKIKLVRVGEKVVFTTAIVDKDGKVIHVFPYEAKYWR